MMTKYACIHACLDKPAYKSAGEAVRTMYGAILRKEQFDPRIHPYECPFGNHFHLGKKKKNVRTQCA